MSWTYDPTRLALSKKDQVRYLIGDVDIKDPQVQDEEITFALTQRSSIYGVAATVCRALAAKLSRLDDVIDRDLHTSQSSRATRYAQRAGELEAQAIGRSAVMPFAGGISRSDKETREQDGDRVKPQFNLGMEDDRLPIGAAGNETLERGEQ